MNTAIFVAVIAVLVLLPFFLVVFVRLSWLPWALAAVGLAIWIGYSIYALNFYECPDHDGECDPGLGVFYLGIAMLFWLGGVAGGAAVRALRRSG
jgi:hypothetical protein